jgi:AraC-like DNA-binding protein
MGYTILQPDARLAPFVESLWVQELPANAPGDPEGVTHILPVGRTELVIDFGDPFVCLRGESDETLPSQVYLGQRTRPISVRGTGRTGLVIVSFHPWAASFFGPADELSDRVTSLSDLVDAARCRQLEDEAGAAVSTAERARAVEELLLDLLPHALPDRRLVAALRRIQHARGDLSIDGLARSLDMSRRHLVRLFRNTVGVPPKTVARILRFQSAACLRRLGHSWSAVAHTAGFFDQAHLSREVRQLSGLTPTQLDRRVEDRPLTRFFNTSDPSRFYNTVYL